MVDIKTFLPSFYDEICEMATLAETENAAFRQLSEDIQRVINNQFIQTCDMDIIHFFERRLGIRPDFAIETPEERRKRVLNRLATRRPFTFWFYRGMMDTLFGKNNSFIEVDYLNFKIDLQIHSFDAAAYNELINYMRITLPANLELFIRLVHHFQTTSTYAPTSISGERVTVSPKSVTDIRVSSPNHWGAGQISGEKIVISPYLVTDLHLQSPISFGSCLFNGEICSVFPKNISKAEASGATYFGTATILGERSIVFPKQISNLETSAAIHLGKSTVSGEITKIYPKENLHE